MTAATESVTYHRVSSLLWPKAGLFTLPDVCELRGRGVTPHRSPFYRFRETLTACLLQSERAWMLYRILPTVPDLVLDRTRPPLLRPAWLDAAAVRPWSRGAIGPGPAGRACQLSERRCGQRSRRRRGARAGRRVQRRRHRTHSTDLTPPSHRDGESACPPSRPPETRPFWPDRRA